MVMPWRWGARGRSVATVLLIAWMLIYAVSFPPMFLWLNSVEALQHDVLREVLWGLYAPLDWLTENSEGAFSLYLWELEMLRESPGLEWLLPQSEPLSKRFRWDPV